jgi:RNA polymerase sigma factor (TIGR02999 family)
MATDDSPAEPYPDAVPPPPVCPTTSTDSASKQAFERVFSEVYAQLRAMAQNQMSHERASHTLGATELVHQAFVRLADDSKVEVQNRGHFVHAVAEAMRRILIEHARRRARLKRGGDRLRVSLSDVVDSNEPSDATLPQGDAELLALHEALRRLEAHDPRAAEVVRLRYFAALTIEQTAEAMNLSPRTVKREWQFARAWLAQRLT